MSNMIFWNAKAPGSVGQMAYLVDGIYRNVASAEGLTLEQLNADGGAYELIPSHEVWERLTNGYVAPVKEIDAERFNDMLEILPPLDWHIGDYYQSFKMAEMLCGNVTSIFAKSGDRYFELSDRVTLTHQEIIKRVRGYIDSETRAA